MAPMETLDPQVESSGRERPLPEPRVVCLASPDTCRDGHENLTQVAIAEQLALIKGARFDGHYDEQKHGIGPRSVSQLYFVPSETLEIDMARRMGIHGEEDLFGGIVPYPFVATKTITHPLVANPTLAPIGWAQTFAEEVKQAVFPGFSAFAYADARAAGRQLLQDGPVRIKLASGTGGLGQAVAKCASELEAALREFDLQGALAQGVVLERNMGAVSTLSIGQVHVGDVRIAYHGVQRLTMDNHGTQVYGGSDLYVVRGDFDALFELDVSPHIHTALAQVRTYHAAAQRIFSGLVASRCNYDVAQGVDREGRWHSGVLEQSWRLGGASGAELAAIQAFKQDPGLRMVHASTREQYGDTVVIPPDATVYYAGVDRRVGRLTKYARIEGYDDKG